MFACAVVLSVNKRKTFGDYFSKTARRCSRTAPLKFVHAIDLKARDMGLAVSKALIQAAPRLSLLPSEILNVIAEFLDDVLIPRHLGSLACSCKVINAAVKDALDKLKVEYDAASALLVRSETTVERVVAQRPTKLLWLTKV